MSNVMKFCGCRQCRVGLHRNGWRCRAVVRRLRRLTKLALRRGEEPPRVASVPYTD